ncbi:metal-sensitive transcriptional regulator [Cohnella soli]|uniref:Metal-sensitive transcriptional regulator n=1 Tax=Cohnella soli TaxID=425005 RepID=A0ABW0HQY6_9BACL
MAYEYNDDVKKRLRRLEGQVRGVLRMMEERKDCKEVITQLSAVRSAADRAIATIVAENLEACIVAEQQSGGDTKRMVKEAIELLVKSR